MPRLGADASVADVAGALDDAGARVVERLITPEKVAALKAELAPHRDATPTGRNDFEGFVTRRIYALFGKVRGFDELATDPLLLGVLDRVLGPHYQLSGPVGIDIGPGESPQSLHRDDSVYPLAWPHQQVVLNTMWALDDFTDDNGATTSRPGQPPQLADRAPRRQRGRRGDDAGRLGDVLRRHRVARGRRQPHRPSDGSA